MAVGKRRRSVRVHATYPDAWYDDQTAILHSEGNGCGICGILRIDAGNRRYPNAAERDEGHSVAFDGDGRTAAVSATVCTSTSTSASEKGIFLLGLDDGVLQAFSDTACDVANWSAEEMPYVRFVADW